MNGEPLKILLVEDNDSHAELVKRNFRNHRVANEIIHVKDGEEALNFLLNKEITLSGKEYVKPNLILLDLRLPKIDGLEVLKQIKSNDEFINIPVVVLTTSEAENDLAKAYKYHANSYLVKPLDFSNFSELMEVLGFYWLGWNRLP